jgi:CheY-like chemotaxis protein
MSATTTIPMTTTRRPRALLLDDDAVTVRLLGIPLERRGFDVRAALDGDDGVAALLDEVLELDVLVVDLDLPGRDGWSFLRLVREAGGERDLAVVVLARADPAAVRAQLRALGADAVVDPAAGPEAAVEVIARAARHAPPVLALPDRVTSALGALLVPLPQAA